MNLLCNIISQILFLEIYTCEGGMEVRLWLARRDKRKGFVFTPLKTVDRLVLKKWAFHFAVISITGDDVVAKPYQNGDPFVKKILDNEKLLWTIHHSSHPQDSFIAFVRKEVVDKYHDLLVDSNIAVLEKFISKEKVVDKEKILLSVCEDKFRWNEFHRNAFLLNASCHVIYHKIQLPILLLFFALLLGNFFVNNNLRKEYELVQNQLGVKQRSEKKLRENRQKLGRLEEKYQNFYSGSFALIADRIASYVPVNVDLVLLSIFPLSSNEEFSSTRAQENKQCKDVIRVKGEVSTPGSVTLFTQLLSADKLFSKIEIISLNRQKEDTTYLFELQLML